MRNHRTPQQWQALIQAFDRSDLTAKDFCRQNKLSIFSFYLWKNRFSQQSSAKPSARDELWLLTINLPVGSNFHKQNPAR